MLSIRKTWKLEDKKLKGVIINDSTCASPALKVFLSHLPFQLCGLLKPYNNQTHFYEASVALISLLARRGQIAVQNPPVWSAGRISPSASMAAASLSLFDKTYPFLTSPLCFRTIVLENGILCSDVPWPSSFWLLQPAATQIVGISFVHNWEISDITSISLRYRFWYWCH